MIIDKQEEFSDSQTIALTSGTNAISTNVLDTGLIQTPFDIAQSQASGAALSGTVGTRDLGIGEPIWLVIQCDEAGVGASGTLTVTLESSAVVALTSSTVHYTSGLIPVASVVIGTLAQFPLPSGAYKQFLGLRYAIATTTFTAGKVSAFLTRTPQKNTIYPSSVVIG